MVVSVEDGSSSGYSNGPSSTTGVPTNGANGYDEDEAIAKEVRRAVGEQGDEGIAWCTGSAGRVEGQVPNVKDSSMYPMDVEDSDDILRDWSWVMCAVPASCPSEFATTL